MTKGNKYRTEDETTFHTQKAKENVDVNTEIDSTTDEKEENNTYEALDPSQTQNAAESPKQMSEESPMPISTDSKPQITVAIVRSIRCLQATCAAMLLAVIIMAVTIGAIMSHQKARIDVTEGKPDLLHSEIDHIRAENNSVVIQSLHFKITQMESDLKSIAAAFKNCTAESTHLKMRVIQLESDRRNDLATLQNYNLRTTELETQSSNYSERIQGQNIRISALEVSLSQQVAFTVRNPADIHSSSTMRFSSTVTNIGGGYNTQSGKFTCSVEGMYFFALSLSKARTSSRRFDYIACYIRKNGAQLIQAYIDPTDDDTDKGGAEVSGFVSVSLSPGDIIDVGSCSYNASAYHSRSSFSGFLFLAI